MISKVCLTLQIKHISPLWNITLKNKIILPFEWSGLEKCYLCNFPPTCGIFWPCSTILPWRTIPEKLACHEVPTHSYFQGQHNTCSQQLGQTVARKLLLIVIEKCPNTKLKFLRKMTPGIKLSLIIFPNKYIQKASYLISILQISKFYWIRDRSPKWDVCVISLTQDLVIFKKREQKDCSENPVRKQWESEHWKECVGRKLQSNWGAIGIY